MIFDWDENKNKLNISKHSIDFNDVTEVFENEMIIRNDDRENYGEERLIGIGKIKKIEIVVIWTKRGDKIRIISASLANKKERKIYYDKINKNRLE